MEKYLSPEQQSAAEAAQQKDEDRRRREMGDNWRDRGLDYMMGGVLEMRKEDELKKVRGHARSSRTRHTSLRRETLSLLLLLSLLIL